MRGAWRCSETSRPRPLCCGVLVIDDTGDRKEGCATDHVARKYLGSLGEIDNGIDMLQSALSNAAFLHW